MKDIYVSLRKECNEINASSCDKTISVILRNIENTLAEKYATMIKVDDLRRLLTIDHSIKTARLWKTELANNKKRELLISKAESETALDFDEIPDELDSNDHFINSPIESEVTNARITTCKNLKQLKIKAGTTPFIK